MDHRFIKFDITKVQPNDTTSRESMIDIEIASILDPKNGTINKTISTIDNEQVSCAIEAIKRAKRDRKQVILCMGAHAIKNGCGTLIGSLVSHGFITHIATNGAGMIHDAEFARFGKSTESVRKNLTNGTFGIWEEIGSMWNESLHLAKYSYQPLGNAFGHLSCSHVYNYREYSLSYDAFRMHVPFTVHPAFGQDIIYTYPLLYWDLLGEIAGNDFLYFAESIRNLSGGVYISMGSSVMSPMIFEKALSIARHVEQREGRNVENFDIIVNDIVPNADFDWTSGKEPTKDNPAYYMRFMKSFSRSGEKLKYICCDNRQFLYSLWKSLVK